MSQTSAIEDGRAILSVWMHDRPKNFFESDPNIQRVLRMYLEEAYDTHLPRLRQTGELSATTMDRLAQETNRDENLPTLRRFNGIGEHTEEVVFPNAYHELGTFFWGSGVLRVLEEPGNEVLSGALVYLLDHNGEAGHACPVACTAGLINLLIQVGTPQQRETFLPRLLETDYEKRLHAAQFVTEVQGGSDVGSNACVAREDPDRPGMYRISGEKWFCSVADASLFVMTARLENAPEGTRGLGLFIVPRYIEGRPNSFAIRRLKYKLGTRSLASGEIDFDGSIGEPIGQLHRGFKNLISIVLDTSRVHNALAACGCMRRALIDGQTYARHRTAFGKPIIEHPMVQQILARMKVDTQAAVATTFRVLAMTDRISKMKSAGEDPADLIMARRTHVNINKYWTAIKCTQVVRDGIEVFGGNGTIEEFCVLPRLYRDAIVLESWEGTHNTLCAQILRDVAQRGLHRQWLGEIKEALSRLEHDSLAAHRERISSLLSEVADRIDRMLDSDNETYAGLHIRFVVDRMCVLNSYLSLVLELDWELGHRDLQPSDKAAVVELYRRLYVDPMDPMDSQDLLELYGQITREL